jgi:hypothetical protein
MRSDDLWFFLAMGGFFLASAKRFGRDLADQLDGPWTPEQRAVNRRWNTLVWRILGAALVAYAGWHLLRV